MKRFICSLLFGSVLCHTGLAGPLPLWQNFGLITDAPTINALAFDNRGEIDLTNTTEIPYVIPYVYETQNTRYFTNRGVMTGTRGFQFDTVRSGKLGMERVPAQVFINSNNGRITGVDGDYSNYGADPIISSCVRVLATNVTNSGEISVGDLGFMQIIGKNVDLSRGALEAGTLSSAVNNTMTHGGYVGTNFNLFVNPYAVQDIYGYVGTSNVWLQSLMTTYGTGNYQAWAYTNMGTTNTYINIVFVQNNTAANFTTDVRFCGTSGADVPANDYDHYATEAIVSIGSVVKDVVTGATATSAFYVLDTGAAQTNYSLLTNDWTVAYIPTFRPSPFQIATALPVEWNSGVSSNLGYTADLIYPGLIASNSYASNLVTGSYAGYSAQVGPSTNVGSVFGNPTNQSAHIEISGDRLNLSNARIRAEGLLGIKAKHLVAQSPVAIDAGNMNLDFGSTNGFLSVSNILPSTFSRSRGSVSCYGFNWVNFTTNALGTHYYKFHVLVVDHDIQPPASPHIRDLALRATSVYAQDTLSVNQSALFDCEKLTLNGNVSLEGKAGVFNDSVAPKLKSLLIDANGVLDANQLNLGIERGDGFVSFTNRGRVSAQVVQIKASLMENSGYLQSHYFVSLNVQAPVSNNFVRNPDAGTLVLTTNKNGKPSQIYSDSECEISARVLRANNADISSGMAGSGALTLNVSHELSDGIVAASGTNNVIKNFWYLNNGFQLSQKPAIGDLFGTRITASGDNNYPIFAWAGEDRGRGVAGFSNNVVIGHLELFCNNADSVLEFKGTGNHNAMYVDFLGFQGRNTNYDQWLLIDPNLVIYFADSNIDPTSLTTAFPGQLVWASEFAGPNSSTNVQAHVGGVLTNIYANRWLATSKSAPFPFDGTFLLATASSGGTISPSLNGKSLLIGTNYTLHAVPDRGYVFRSWVISNSTAVVTSSLPSLTFAMQSNLVIQAQFVFDPSYLRVTIGGAGKVTPDLTSNSLAFGTTYQLTATPTAGNVFAGWSGGVTNTNATLSFIMRSNLPIAAKSCCSETTLSSTLSKNLCAFLPISILLFIIIFQFYMILK